MAVLLIALSISTKVTFLLLSLMLHCYVHATFIISSNSALVSIFKFDLQNFILTQTDKTEFSDQPHSKPAGQFQSTSERCAKRRGC